MFSGTRGRQIAGRFASVTTSAFGYSTPAEQTDWARLVATIEDSLRLHRHTRGTLLRRAAYLHQRTGGMIGSLDQLLHEAANDAHQRRHREDHPQAPGRRHPRHRRRGAVPPGRSPPARRVRRRAEGRPVKLWTAPARVLPVTIRPAGGETVTSYARRLSAANELPATAILRALGQLSCSSGYHLFDLEAWPNEQAAGRLETYSGISRDQLA